MAASYVKTKLEKELFALKYAFWIRQKGNIPDDVIQQFKADVRRVKNDPEYLKNHGIKPFQN